MEKLNNIKIAFIDIDGTLTNSKKEITNTTVEAVKKLTSKGIYVVLCSGRTNSYVCEFSKTANASNYVITCNGAEIYDYKKKKNIYSNKLSLKDVTALWNYCKERNIECNINTEYKRYTNKENNQGKVLINNIKEIENIDVFQVVAGHQSLEVMDEMKEYITLSPTLKIANASSIYLKRLLEGNGYFFDITNKDVSKGAAIEKVLKHLNISKENSIGFGDHINDYDLFNAVGFKVAMGNANEKLKEKADYVTLTNDENGVADFINKFLL